MSDDFYIDYYDHGNTEFVVDNSLTNQVRVRIDYYPIANDVNLAEDNNEVYTVNMEVTQSSVKRHINLYIEENPNTEKTIFESDVKLRASA